jgi:uncharacterized glyoxalase superfamily protein PhnB
VRRLFFAAERRLSRQRLASFAYSSRPPVQFAYVDDVDAVFRRALAAGASAIAEPSEQPWGDRVGGFHDPLGNRWWVATHGGDST